MKPYEETHPSMPKCIEAFVLLALNWNNTSVRKSPRERETTARFSGADIHEDTYARCGVRGDQGNDGWMNVKIQGRRGEREFSGTRTWKARTTPKLVIEHPNWLGLWCSGKHTQAHNLYEKLITLICIIIPAVTKLRNRKSPQCTQVNTDLFTLALRLCTYLVSSIG